MNVARGFCAGELDAVGRRFISCIVYRYAHHLHQEPAANAGGAKVD